MKIMIVFPFLLALILNLGAQQPKADAPAPVQKSAPAAAKTQVKKAKQALPAAPAKAGADQEADEGSVMIDSKAEEDSADQAEDTKIRPAAETEEINVPRGMPASYGQLKGTLNDDRRNLLVFENEEGVISFVQVFVGKNAVSWKLISRIRRSAD